MKRIIGVLLAAFICLGMQMNISHAENWQTVYDVKGTYQVQLDLDSAERIGPNVYRAWERGIYQNKPTGQCVLNEYNVQSDKTGMYCGTISPIAGQYNGQSFEMPMKVNNPVYSMNISQMEVFAYLQKMFGDEPIPMLKWEEIYSAQNIKYVVETSYIKQYDDCYGAWVSSYNDARTRSVHMRMEYKKDKNGKLLVRSLFRSETNAQMIGKAYMPDTRPQKWEPAEGNPRYPMAEKEFAFIKSYLGEK